MSFQECQPSELNIFAPTPLQRSVIGNDEIEYQNINSLDNATVIEFNIVNKSNDTYLDLSSATLYFQIQALKTNGAIYKENSITSEKTDARETQPSFVNNMLSSLIKNVTVSMNNVVVSSCALYSYKAYIDTVLNYGTDATKTQLALGGFFMDDVDKLDTIEDTENYGTEQRRNLLYNSAVVNLYSKLDVDVFSTPRLLINGIDLKITLTLNEKQFYLMEKNESKINIIKSSVFIRHCRVNENILLMHHKMLNAQNAIYPYSKSNLKSFTIPSLISSYQIDNIVSGVLPNSLIFGFVSNEAFNGKKSVSPYNFQNFGLSSFTLYVNGIPISGHPLEIMKNGETRLMHPYRSLFLNTQSLYKDTTSLITYDHFKGGYFLIPINLSPTLELSGSLCSSLLRQGVIKVELKFHEVVLKPLNMIVYTETTGMFTIDRNRKIELAL